MVSQRMRVMYRAKPTIEAVHALTDHWRFCVRVLLIGVALLPAFVQGQLDLVWKKGIDGKDCRWMRFSADGRLVASAHSGNTLRIWRLEDETLLSALYYEMTNGGIIYDNYESCCRGLVYHMNSSCYYNGTPCFAYSPSGSSVAVGYGELCYSPEGTPHLSGGVLLLRSDGTFERIFTGCAVNSVAFSPADDTLAYAGNKEPFNDAPDAVQGFIGLIRNGRRVTIHLPRERVLGIAFSPDGSHIASVNEAYRERYERYIRIKIWRVEDGDLARIIVGHGDRIAFSPDGSLVASWYGNGSGLIRVSFLRVQDGQLIRAINIERSGSADIVFSHDWTLIASTVGPDIKLWRVEDGALIHTLVGHAGQIKGFVFSLDNRLLASGGEDRTVRVWSVRDGTLLHTLRGHLSQVESVIFSPDAQLVLSASSDSIILWRTASGSLMRRLGERGSELVFSPDGRLTASISDKRSPGTVELRRASDGTLLRTLTGGSKGVAFSPDGSLVASGEPGSVRVWRVADGSLMQTFGGESFRFSPNGDLIATIESNMIKLWRLSDGSMAHAFAGKSFEFSPDGRLLAAIQDNIIRLWRLEDNSLLYTITGRSRYHTVRFSPDGQLLATARDQANIVELWTVNDGTLAATLHFDVTDCPWNDAVPLHSFALSPDGNTLVAWGGTSCSVGDSSYYGAVYTAGASVRWNLWNYTEIDRSSEDKIVKELVFSPDGKSTLWGYHKEVIHFNIPYIERQTCFGILLKHASENQPRERCDGASPVQFSPNGRLLGYVGKHGSVVVLQNPYWRRGDVDGDGCVNDIDLLRVILAFGSRDGGLEDMDGDGVIDDIDLIFVLLHFGNGC